MRLCLWDAWLWWSVVPEPLPPLEYGPSSGEREKTRGWIVAEPHGSREQGHGSQGPSRSPHIARYAPAARYPGLHRNSCVLEVRCLRAVSKATGSRVNAGPRRRPWETVNLTQDLFRRGLIYVTSKPWERFRGRTSMCLMGFLRGEGKIIIFMSFAAAVTKINVKKEWF